MKVSSFMSRPPVTTGPLTPVSEAAGLMRDRGVGFLPVVEGGRVVGTLTDRDIVQRAVAGKAGTAPGNEPAVRDVMNGEVVTCPPDIPVEKAAILMADHQVRRLPVIDARGALVGVLSLGDIAENVSEVLAGETLGEIVEKR